VNGHASNGHGVNGHGSDGAALNGHGADGAALNGHEANSAALNGHTADGQSVNGYATDGSPLHDHGADGTGHGRPAANRPVDRVADWRGNDGEAPAKDVERPDGHGVVPPAPRADGPSLSADIPAARTGSSDLRSEVAAQGPRASVVPVPTSRNGGVTLPAGPRRPDRQPTGPAPVAALPAPRSDEITPPAASGPRPPGSRGLRRRVPQSHLAPELRHPVTGLADTAAPLSADAAATALSRYQASRLAAQAVVEEPDLHHQGLEGERE
jgi:hypothetical protein